MELYLRFFLSLSLNVGKDFLYYNVFFLGGGVE